MQLTDIIIIALYSYIMALSVSAALVIVSANKKFQLDCYCTKFRHRHLAIVIMLTLSSAFIVYSQWINPISGASPWTLASLCNGVALVFGTWNVEEKERDRLTHHKCIKNEE